MSETRSFRIALPLCILTTVLATSPAQAQDATLQGRSVIHGRILEQGRTRAIEGATVTLLPANIQFTTDANGRFLFEGVAAGTHTLRSVLDGTPRARTR